MVPLRAALPFLDVDLAIRFRTFQLVRLLLQKQLDLFRSQISLRPDDVRVGRRSGGIGRQTLGVFINQLVCRAGRLRGLPHLRLGIDVIEEHHRPDVSTRGHVARFVVEGDHLADDASSVPETTARRRCSTAIDVPSYSILFELTNTGSSDLNIEGSLLRCSL